MKTKSNLRTILALFLCLIMAFSAAIFTACDFSANSSGSASQNSSASSSTSSPDTSSGTNEKPSGPDREQSETLRAVTDAAREQEIKSLSLSGTAEKKSDSLLKADTTYTLDGKANTAEGDGDFTVISKTPDGLISTETVYNYAFLRDSYAFTLSSEEKAVSVWDSSVTLNYSGIGASPLQSILEQAGVSSEGLEAGELFVSALLSGSVSYVNAAMLSLANYTNAATEKTDSVEVDVNKAIYTLSCDLKEILSSVDENMTVEEFLKSDVVSSYMETLFSDLTAADLKAALNDILRGLIFSDSDSSLGSWTEGFDKTIDATMAASILRLLAVSPDKNSTAYEYIVKVVCSEEFSDLFNYIIQSNDETAEKIDIADTPLSDIFGRADTSKEELLDALDCFKESSFEIDSNGLTFALSDMKCVYNLNDDNTISSLDASFTLHFAYGSYDYPLEVELSVVFSDVEITLTDISECNVNISEPRFEDGTNETKLEIPAGEETVTGYAVFENNGLVGFELSHQTEEVSETIESNYDAETRILTFTYAENEYTYNVVMQTEEVAGEGMLIAIYNDDIENFRVFYIKASETETETCTVAAFLEQQAA